MIKRFLTGVLLVFLFAITVFNCSNAETSSSPYWKKTTINVYIPKNSKALTMQHAFEKWQNMSAGKLKFKFVQKGPADIDVVFSEKVSGSDGQQLGDYKLTVKNGYITKAEIRMATEGKKQVYSDNMVYTIMLHEVGHALGLPDKNRKKNSIMYMPISVSQDINKMDMRELYKLNGWEWLERRSSSN